MDKVLSNSIKSFVDEDIKNMDENLKNNKIKELKMQNYRPAFLWFVLTIFFIIVTVIFNKCITKVELLWIIPLIFTIAAFLVFLIKIFGAIFLSDQKLLKDYLTQKYKSSSNSMLEEKLLGCSKQDKNFLDDEQFHISKTVEIKTLKVLKGKIKLNLLLDERNKKFVFRIDENKFSKIYKFKDLLGFKTCEDVKVEDVSNTKLNINLVLLPLAILSGNTLFLDDNSEPVNYCTNLYIVLVVNDDKIKNLIVPYAISNVKKKSDKYKAIKEDAEQLEGVLEKIQKENPITQDEIEDLKLQIEKEKLSAELEKLKPAKLCVCKYCGVKVDSRLPKCPNCGGKMS